ncbi:DNA-3-methyladenine glycosylase I domain protein [Mycobacterium xenopi 4042]|uniref:DNA-3-methyladenine glycosylase I domain protein n=1 Tax=Mycobacterium xenopi 4042 TaxID=1299334 RepID=X8E0J7_MYCXE|nr:DNA-3-methyladenine glycosylase I domain protein [Mycobacterium xenopi 4042]
MALVLLYLVVLILLALVLFGVASLLFGRGEQLPPLPRATTATVLPASGVTGADVEAVKFTQVLRGTRPVRWTGCWIGSARNSTCCAASSRRLPPRPGRRPRRPPRRQGTGVTAPDGGLIRCPWATTELYRDYHDREWAVRCATGCVVRADVPGGLSERTVVADHPAQAGALSAGLRRLRHRNRRRLHRRRRDPVDGRRHHRAQPGQDRSHHRQRAGGSGPGLLRRPSRVAVVVRAAPRPRPADASEIPSAPPNPPPWHANSSGEGFGSSGPPPPMP